MTKKPSLFAAPKSVVTATAAKTEPVTDAAEPKRRPPSREGKRVLSIYLSSEAWKQLRMLAVNSETTTQALGEEAINLLFEKHHTNRIA